MQEEIFQCGEGVADNKVSVFWDRSSGSGVSVSGTRSTMRYHDWIWLVAIPVPFRRGIGFLPSKSALGEPFNSVWKEVSSAYIGLFQQGSICKVEMRFGVRFWTSLALWLTALVFYGVPYLATGSLLTTMGWASLAFPRLPVIRWWTLINLRLSVGTVQPFG